jgi:nucleoside-diphosphate-sugar epimerase
VKQVAVTGAGGFLGAALLTRLAAEPVQVRALVGPPAAPVPPLPAGVDARHGEIDQLPAVAELVRGCDTVFHLAGPASVAASFDAPAEFARVHVAGTATLLEACRHAGVARIVHVSSAEVYGAPQWLPVDESHRLQARSPYAAAKIGAERMIEAFALAHGAAVTVLRPFSIYGPRQSRGGVIAHILGQLRRGDAVELAAPEVVRDFCFVDDVAEALVAAAGAPASGLRVFNVASGSGITLAALARAAALAAGRDLPVRARAAGADRPRAAGLDALVGDRARIEAALGWRPRTALADGLRRTLAWFRTSEDA